MQVTSLFRDKKKTIILKAVDGCPLFEEIPYGEKIWICTSTELQAPCMCKKEVNLIKTKRDLTFIRKLCLLPNMSSIMIYLAGYKFGPSQETLCHGRFQFLVYTKLLANKLLKWTQPKWLKTKDFRNVNETSEHEKLCV